MAISSAFAISRSGLASVEKWSEITSANIANADRAGYSKKSVLLETAAAGGVAVSGIRREADLLVDRQHRAEMSRVERQDAIASGISLYTSRLGEPNDPNALNARVAELETAFVQLSAAPEQSARQSAVLIAAENLAREINAAAGALSETESIVEQRVEDTVTGLNKQLVTIAELNRKIMGIEPGTHQHAVMTDEISVALDGLAEFADTRVRFDEAGRATVYTAGGMALVEEDRAKVVSFDIGTATLSADSLDITPGQTTARGFSEGRLAGQIALLRDEMPRMELQLDELARGLVSGFESADASLPPGAAGLFTDAGVAFAPGNLEGLSARIVVNDAVRPEAGGELWRLRDGIGSAAEGLQSDNTQVAAFVAMLEADQFFDAAAGLGTNRTLGDFAGALVVDQQYVRVEAESLREAFQASANSIGVTRSSISGVNVDDELQRLIQIEQSYAANSQVMRTLSEMVDTLLAAF